MDSAVHSPVHSSPVHSQRLLAAIMVIDAVGFSARMSEDEEKALALIHRDLKLMTKLAPSFEGTVLKSTGDGLLMYFFSAVQAVACGLAIQQRLAECVELAGTPDPFMYRIGIHLGDVFINAADVMGAGVNIAARLEAACVPGGLCISQVVYEVVKGRLDLNATYLGVMPLKNIQEQIAAYQINLSPVEQTQVVASGGPLPASGAAQLRKQAVQSLMQDPNYLRIKKLIFGACQRLWENDPAVLEQFPLGELVTMLLQQNPTLADCKATLQRMAVSLNHKAEYVQVADTIVNRLASLYALGAQAERIVPAALAARYQQIAERCDRNPHGTPLKQLLYWLCSGVWETSPERLTQLDTRVLVARLHQLAPTCRHLKYRLHYFLQKVNSRRPYKTLAQSLFKQLAALYSQNSTSTPESAANLTDTPTPAKAAAPDPSSGPSTAPLLKNRRDLSELQQAITQSCDLTQAKILLHSVLYGPFSYSQQDWHRLQNKSLDSLLHETFNYCPTIEDVDGKLTILSHCLPNPSENALVVNAILAAIRDYYPPAKPPKLPKRRKKAAAAPAQTLPAPERVPAALAV
jgi:class 3 adenylate cyclase